jgi:hypothetical protein
LAVLTLAERILELQVRTATDLDQNLNLRTLKYDEWQAKIASPEYKAIEKKLAQPQPAPASIAAIAAPTARHEPSPSAAPPTIEALHRHKLPAPVSPTSPPTRRGDYVVLLYVLICAGLISLARKR